MSPKLRTFIVTVSLCLVSICVFAQKDPPPPPQKVPLPGLVVPIDEHLIVLVFMGVVAGALFFYNQKKTKVVI